MHNLLKATIAPADPAGKAVTVIALPVSTK